jgi:TolB protein
LLLHRQAVNDHQIILKRKVSVMKKSIQYTVSLPFLKSAIPVVFCTFFSISSIAQNKHDTTSYIQTVDIKTGKIDTILIAEGRYEAPN